MPAHIIRGRAGGILACRFRYLDYEKFPISPFGYRAVITVRPRWQAPDVDATFVLASDAGDPRWQPDAVDGWLLNVPADETKDWVPRSRFEVELESLSDSGDTRSLAWGMIVMLPQVLEGPA